VQTSFDDGGLHRRRIVLIGCIIAAEVDRGENTSGVKKLEYVRYAFVCAPKIGMRALFLADTPRKECSVLKKDMHVTRVGLWQRSDTFTC
jgi:hypothetical protein